MAKYRSEFHRPVLTHDLPVPGRSFDIEAGPDERTALARQFEIVAVNRLHASGLLRHQASGRRVKVEGRLSAEVVQTCVITLEPVTAVIEVPLERLYSFDKIEDAERESDEIFLDLGDDLPAELLSEHVVDVGAAAAEQLGLELDPYPRKPGAVFEGVPGATPDDPTGALAPLAAWCKRPNEVG